MAGGGPHKEAFKELSGRPEIQKMSDIVYWILDSFGKSNKNINSRLTRVHFHTLSFHIIGIVKNEWTESANAVAAGTRIAGMQACDLSQFDPEQFELRIPKVFYPYTGAKEHVFDPKSPVLRWERENFIFYFSPVLICKNPLKTVGLGDAISGTALMFSQFNNYKN